MFCKILRHKALAVWSLHYKKPRNFESSIRHNRPLARLPSSPAVSTHPPPWLEQMGIQKDPYGFRFSGFHTCGDPQFEEFLCNFRDEPPPQFLTRGGVHLYFCHARSVSPRFSAISTLSGPLYRITGFVDPAASQAPSCRYSVKSVPRSPPVDEISGLFVVSVLWRVILLPIGIFFELFPCSGRISNILSGM